MELVLHDEGAVLDPPEPLTGPQAGEQLLLGAGEPEREGGGAELVRLLPVHDPGLRIRQQRRGEGAHRGPGIADVVEVGELVEDQHVGQAVMAGEPPMGVHAFEQGGMAHQTPGLVVDDPPLPAGRVLQVVPKERTALRIDTGVRLALKRAHEQDMTMLISPEGQVEPPTNIENAFLLEVVPFRFDMALPGSPPEGSGGDTRKRWAMRAEFSPEIELLPGHQAPTIGVEVSRAWAGGPAAVKITYGMNLSASKGIFK